MPNEFLNVSPMMVFMAVTKHCQLPITNLFIHFFKINFEYQNITFIHAGTIKHY